MKHLATLKAAVDKMREAADSWYGCEHMSYIHQFADALNDVSKAIEQEQTTLDAVSQHLNKAAYHLSWNGCKAASDAIYNALQALNADDDEAEDDSGNS